ncbi:MAG: hypothetical protein EXS07_07830, partial [Gemmataceae bacterium]|nr:hypothetical protein [Gemmataceae bacterium]
MPRELIYTAADEGIDGLRGCLCYAGASTDALSNKLLLQNLLAINNYQELYKAGNPRAHNNPIGFSHYRFNAGVRDCSVISRIGPAPLYANRTNFIAHHVILDDMDKAKAGPAWAIKNFKFRDQWSPQIGRLDTQRIAIGSLDPQVCNYWKSIVGDAGWAGWLAERAQSGKPITVLYPTGYDPLALLQEAIALLPEYQRWNITFSTYYTLGGRGPNCSLRFIPLEADNLAAPFSDKTFHDGVLNLSRSLGNAPAGALVNLARGEKPKDKPIPLGSSFIPSFDPIKSDIPGLMSSKDSLRSKSELFIDPQTNFESFDNLKPSGPDNTWKTIKFVAGILGLLFLLVLPSLLTWLITTATNKSKFESAKQANIANLEELNVSNKKLEAEKNQEKKKLDKANDDLAKKLEDKTNKEKEIKEINDSLKVSNISNVKDINELYDKYEENKNKKSALVKMPKQVMEELRDAREKSKNIIASKNEKIIDEKTFELLLKNNKGKVLDDGNLILTYLEAYEKDLSAKFISYDKDKTRIYFATKAWLDADKLTPDDKNLIDFLKKDHKAKLSGVNVALNDNCFFLPVELLILSNILTLKNPSNLALYVEFKDNLEPLRNLLFDDKATYLDDKKFKTFLGADEKKKKRLIFENKDDNVILENSKLKINQKDWNSFADEF